MRMIPTDRHRTLPVFDLSAQYHALKPELTSAIMQVLEDQHFILGPNVAALEGEIAYFLKCSSAVGVASGTDALILALRAAGVGAGNEVIVPAFSFVATADAVSILGAKPVFADIDPVTFNIDMGHAATLVTERTVAIIPVHLYGQPADMDAVRDLAEKKRLTVIEDCAQAMGANWKGSPVASIGDYGCISFFPTKNLGGYGDGGMITTRDRESADRLRRLRTHGSRKKYHFEEQGMNSRLDELQAAILRVKLPKLTGWNQARRNIAALYRQALEHVEELVLPLEASGATHVYHQFTVRVPARDHVQMALLEAGIQSVVYYPVPLHLQDMYRELGHQKGDLPAAERAAAEVLSLPMFPEMTETDVAYVAECLKEILASVR
jgi:UDP-N-acetyl-3-dehydro-alpha-D-glucosamine 3-aminotranferase